MNIFEHKMSSIYDAFAKIPVPPEVGEWIVNMTFNEGYWNYEKYIEDYKNEKEYMNVWEYFTHENRRYDKFFEEINDFAEMITNEYPVLIADIVAVLDKYDYTAEYLVYEDNSGNESWASERPGELPVSKTYPAIGFLKHRILYLLESTANEDVEKLMRWYSWRGYCKSFAAYHENKINRIKEAINEYEKRVKELKAVSPEKTDEDEVNDMNKLAEKILFAHNYDNEPNGDVELDDEFDYATLDDDDDGDEEEDEKEEN